MKTHEKWINVGKNKIPTTGMLQKYIGAEVLFVDFKKEEGGWNTLDPTPVTILSMTDYEPFTGTYKVKYQSRTNKEPKEERITSTGFSFNDPEKDGWMHRFITYSFHFESMETELFINRLSKLFKNTKGLDPSIFSAYPKEVLRGAYVAGVVDSDIEGGLGKGIIQFRVSEFIRLEKIGKSWRFGMRDEGGTYLSVPSYSLHGDSWVCEKWSVDGRILGNLKLIDISGEE